jgi:hypothetical protein
VQVFAGQAREAGLVVGFIGVRQIEIEASSSWFCHIDFNTIPPSLNNPGISLPEKPFPECLLY